MELLVIVSIKLSENLDNIGVGIGTTEGIASTVEAKNEFDVFIGNYRLLDVRAHSGRHFEQ
jgi:hypothetical protein